MFVSVVILVQLGSTLCAIDPSTAFHTSNGLQGLVTISRIAHKLFIMLARHERLRLHGVDGKQAVPQPTTAMQAISPHTTTYVVGFSIALLGDQEFSVKWDSFHRFHTPSPVFILLNESVVVRHNNGVPETRVSW